ncbi:S-adenosylmethionine:tRNA ribosyltransferase-isomerase [Bryobacterales bacterium F-183]|nr:S-adenosylmethionine:tRNA ribosyltransferase-isomerase [Bryobacterales bacterium F-183]
MLLSDFHYDLPPELIAQEPLPDRSASRMLVVDRATGTLTDRIFRDLPEYIQPGDCVVLNNSKVLPARLYGQREGHRVETFLLEPVTADRLTWKVLVKPGRRAHVDYEIEYDPQLTGTVIERLERGMRVIRFTTHGDEPFDAIIDRIGHVPLPPYVKRPDADADKDRYQTVFAQHRGSVAAPTAGLHFTNEVLDAIRARGADIAQVTLHVGLGTFQPLASDVVSEVELHHETFAIDQANAQRIADARRVVCVGTTATRTVETAAVRCGKGQPCSGSTNLFIYPGFEFQSTGALLTNFHLPGTSLMLLVAALAGKELILDAYRHAVQSRYRFFSYGDCMLII